MELLCHGSWQRKNRWYWSIIGEGNKKGVD
jgi:hypothetical protein